MVKSKQLILMILLVILCMTNLAGCTGYNKKESTRISNTSSNGHIDSKEKKIVASMATIFSCQTIEEFNRSREECENTLYTKEISNRLYKSYSKSLNKHDTNRSVICVLTSSRGNNTKKQNIHRIDVAISNKEKQDNRAIILEYIAYENDKGIIDKVEQRQLEYKPIALKEYDIEPLSLSDTKLETDGSFGYSTGCIERNSVDTQLKKYIETIENEKILGDSMPPKYFIYGSMLVEASITRSGNLYDKSLPDIYQDTMIATTGEEQYIGNNVKQGNIIKDKKVMIGPFQISSAYYEEWIKLAPDNLITSSGGYLPADITNRGTTGQPLYLPDVVLGKLNICSKKIESADSYMKLNYTDWEGQPKEVKQYFGVMWYNIEYHGGQNGIKHAKENPIILDYLYDICKAVYEDPNFLNSITNWSQASSLDNECIKQICQKIDMNGMKGYMAGYKKYAQEGLDTYLGDWVYAPKCLHFGLKRISALN